MMKKKKSSYKKLKEDNARLKRELREVCLNPSSQQSSGIIIRERIGQDIENIVWSGDRITDKTFSGIFTQIKTDKP